MTISAPSTLSYDVFDTVITRLTYFPSDIFLAVGVILRSKGMVPDPERWAVLREKTERSVRRASPHSEITITEIYDALISPCGWSPEQARVARGIELQTEVSLIRPIAAIQYEIAKFRSTQDRCIFISDTYFSRREMIVLMRAGGIRAHASDVFISSEFRKTKAQGKLFYAVRLAIEPHKIERHAGDNYRSDVGRARQAGLAASHVTVTQPTRYERRLYYGPKATRSVRSAVAGAARAARLSEHWQQARHDTFWTIGTNVMGPLLFSYVLWVLLDAKRRGLARLYFVARDGWIMREIAAKIDGWLDFGIECRYLFGSRQAWHGPSIQNFDGGFPGWLLENAEISTPQKIIERLGLSWDECVRLRERVGLTNYDKDNSVTGSVRTSLLALFREGGFRQMVHERTSLNRGLLQAYLEQEEILNDPSPTLVDVGWHAHMQLSLNTVLRSCLHESKKRFFGYYFGLSNHVDASVEQGVSGYLLERTLAAQSVHQNRTLVEIMCSASHGTTIGYRRVAGGRVDPILGSALADVSPDWSLGLKVQHQAILAFAEQFVIAARALDVRPEDALAHLKSATLENWGLFVWRPGKDEAVAYGSILHNHEQGGKDNEHLQEIAQRFSWNKLLVLLWLSPKRLGAKTWWIEGAMVRSLPSWLASVALVFCMARVWILYMLHMLRRLIILLAAKGR
jgi:hypothetical protein